MDRRLYCSLCNRDFYNGWKAHMTTYGHKTNLKWKKEKEKAEEDKRQAEEDKRQKENDFACQLASALEGHTLNPGDVVGLRDGREFKADIHGTLFEIPIGS